MAMTDQEMPGLFERVDPLALIQTWQGNYNQAKMDRLPFEKQWHLNMSFFLGKQWVQWSHADITPAARLLEFGSNKKRARLTVNRIRLAVRKELAKLNKERIRGYVISSTADDDDLAASRGAEKLADYLQTKLKLARIMSYADLWTLIYGTSFLKHYYDPNALGPDGPVPVTDAKGFTVIDPSTGQPMMEQQPMLGMPAVEAVSPFNILVPNVDTLDIEKQDWVMHCVVRTRKEVEDLYGVSVPDEGVIATNTADSRQQEAYGKQQQARRRGVEVKEVWVKPCVEYPEGLRLVWVGDRILQAEEGWPYEHKEYPFSRRIMTPTGRFYGSSTIEDIIPLQIEYNAARSQLIENRNYTSRPGFLAQRGSIDIRKLNNAPGSVVEYKQGTQPPVPLPAPQIPSYVVQLLEVVRSEIDELTSQNEGVVPNGVEAAAAISYLIENQDSILQDTLRDKEDVWQKITCQFLSYVIQYWDANRTIKVVGNNQNFEAFTLKAADLRGNTDYRVEVGSATPVSRSAKQAQITELIKLGAVDPPQGLEHLELGDLAKLTEDMQIDSRQAERENLKLSKGVWCDVNPYDDHMVHIREHDNYRKREEAENSNEQIRAMLGNHVVSHLYKLAMTFGFQPQMLDPQSLEVLMVGQQNHQVWSPVLETKLRDFILTMSATGGMPPEGAESTNGSPQ